MLQIRERDAGEHLVDAPFEQAPHGANAAGRRRIAAFSIDPVQVAVHLEGHVLRRFDDVFDADGMRRPGQQVAAARPTDGIDQTRAPQAPSAMRRSGQVDGKPASRSPRSTYIRPQLVRSEGSYPGAKKIALGSQSLEQPITRNGA